MYRNSIVTILIKAVQAKLMDFSLLMEDFTGNLLIIY